MCVRVCVCGAVLGAESELMGRVLTVNLAKPQSMRTTSNKAVWADADEWKQLNADIAEDGGVAAGGAAAAAAAAPPGVQGAGAAAAEAGSADAAAS